MTTKKLMLSILLVIATATDQNQMGAFLVILEVGSKTSSQSKLVSFYYVIKLELKLIFSYNLNRKQAMTQSNIEQKNVNWTYKRPYHKVTLEEEQKLIWQVMENKTSISKAAIQVGINNSTAKIIIRKHKKNHKNGLKHSKKEEKDLLDPYSQQKAPLFIYCSQSSYPIGCNMRTYEVMLVPYYDSLVMFHHYFQSF